MSEGRRIDLEPGWLAELEAEFQQPYMQQLRAFLLEEKRRGKVIYPAARDWFNAFRHTPLSAVKVVILGQDPYHGPGQAHGLCFSVPTGVAPPPSLQNIFAELARDLGLPRPEDGCLVRWADQGVLLLNSVLTVEQGRAASHQGKGWEIFTDRVVEVLNARREHLVFMLWGGYAEKKGRIVDRARHLVLVSPHPSPLSAHRGFIGNGHFSRANRYLEAMGIAPVDWGAGSH
ncbi:MAG: uracil-DNA glycosylase [Gammaproteobacteria bacterium]